MIPDTFSVQRWSKSSFYRFGVTSGLAFATNLGVAVVFHELLGIPADRAYAVALAVVFIQSFLLLRWYVYGHQSESGIIQFLKYAPSALAFRGVEFLGFLLLHKALGLDYRLAICVIAGASFITKFLYYRKVVFRG